jgi:hypothetical protein|tara:strand:- start:2594 stop:2815 length:222 start_codon:yes stop_codon:yes gene_type:complete
VEWRPLECKIKIGDLVYHEDYLLKEMGIVVEFDPSPAMGQGVFGEDYAWIYVINGVNLGQKKWTRIKYLRKCE